MLIVCNFVEPIDSRPFVLILLLAQQFVLIQDENRAEALFSPQDARRITAHSLLLLHSQRSLLMRYNTSISLMENNRVTIHADQSLFVFSSPERFRL